MRLAAKILKYVINALMIAACIMALAGLAIGPVWEFKATVYFNEELADKLSGVVSNGGSSENGDADGSVKNDETDGAMSGEEIFKQALEEMVKDNVKVPVSLKFSNENFLISLFEKNGQPVDDLIDSMVDEAFGEEFKAEVEKVKKSATKGATKVMVKQAVSDLKNSSEQVGEIFKDKSADEILAEAGISDEELDTKIEAVYDVLTQDKTVEEAAESITDIVKDVYDKISESDLGKQYPDAFKNTDESAEEMKKQISKVLVALSMVGSGEIDVEDIGNIEITDEMLAEGMSNTVNLSGIFDKILLDSLKEVLGSEDAPYTAPEDDRERSGRTAFNGAFGAFAINDGIALLGSVTENGEAMESAKETESVTETDPTEKPVEGDDVYAEIKAMLKTKFKSAVPDEYKDVILIVMKIIAAIILLNALVWVYLLVKLVVNTIVGKFGTKIKIATLLGWESGFNLVILPTILFNLFTTHNAVSTALNIPVSEISKTVGLKFASGSVYAFYATIAVVGLWIVGKILDSVFKENKD